MLNPQQIQYAERLEQLISEGNHVALLEKPSSAGRFIQREDNILLHVWLTKVCNIIEVTFGQSSSHYGYLKALIPKGVRHISNSNDVYPIIGLLKGALDDLKNGYLLRQEFFIAGEVFDSVLEQAKYLVKNGYKDPSAVLARTVLEDALKRLARTENIDDKKKASVINDELKTKGKYSQSQWRQIQSWLDIGNSAAHGKFNDYTQTDVVKLIEDIERFIATSFHT